MWLKHDLYPTTRGTVTGQLTVRGGMPAAGAQIVLAAPQQGRTPNWQQQGKGFQFWAKTDEHGAFRIPKVRAGEYTRRRSTTTQIDTGNGAPGGTSRSAFPMAWTSGLVRVAKIGIGTTNTAP